MIDQHTKLYGVVGYPLSHSLSPMMHNTAFSKSGVNAVYVAFESMDIKGCLNAIKALDIGGLSVTIPHKSEVIPLLDEVDSLAQEIGAVNTIVHRNGRLVGYNTDAAGALRALEDQIELSGKTCLIIGAGGAARAIGFILKEHGVQLIIANRSLGRGEKLANSLGCPFMPLEKIKDSEADLLIQTTPVGMHPRGEQSVVTSNALRDGMAVMDIVYNPLETRLLRMAKARGCLTINGLAMFVHQGAEQYKLWTGLEAPIGSMTRVVKEALRRNK